MSDAGNLQKSYDSAIYISRSVAQIAFVFVVLTAVSKKQPLLIWREYEISQVPTLRLGG